MQPRIDSLIDLALDEDVAFGDVTSQSIFSVNDHSKARILARQVESGPLTLSGSGRTLRRIPSVLASSMTVEDLKIAANALPEHKRLELTASLIEMLGAPSDGISDQEIQERKRQLDSGEVADISYDELVSGLDLPD